MTRGYYCPVESCEKHHENWTAPDDPPFGSQKGVQMHIYAKSDDPHHDAEERGRWTDVEPRDLADDADEGDGDDGDGDDEEGKDPPEAADPDGSESMTDTEARDQWTSGGNGSGTESSSNDSGGGSDKSREPSSGGGGVPIPVSTTTLLVGLTAVALAVWIVSRGSRSGRNRPAEDPEDDTLDTDRTTGTTVDRDGGGLA